MPARARRAGAHARRRAGAHRQRVRRQRHVARQRLDGRAQGAARADGVGHRHAADVGRMDALHARAPLRPAGDGGARRLARRASTSRAYDVLVLPSGTYTALAGDGAAPPQGLDQRRRHADHDRRGVALGGARQRRPAGDVDRAEGRQARGRPVAEPRSRREKKEGSASAAPDRLREGDPAGARAAGRHARRAAARHARSRALAVVRHRRRDPGDGRRRAHLHAAEAGQGPQRRHLRQGRRAGRERPGVERRADAVREQGRT